MRCSDRRIFGRVSRRAGPVVVATLMLASAAGCGGAATHPRGAGGTFPIVVPHPRVVSHGLPSAAGQLKGNRIALLSASSVGFMTSATVSCAWWPRRLTVLSPSSIRIDMRVNGDVSSCGSGATAFPIAVTIDPRVVDVRHPVTVRLAYKVELPSGGGTRRWSKTATVPAFSGS